MSKIRHYDLSVVIPAYQEAHCLAGSLQQLNKYIKKSLTGLRVEVILVVANARDDTLKIAQNQAKGLANYRVIEPGPPVGKGRDVRLGMLAANGDYICFMDADLATPLHHLKTAYQTLRDKKADIVIGTRDLRAVHPSRLRRFISLSGNWLFRRIIKINIRDTQCGFKMFSAKAARLCFGHQTVLGWGFDMELIVIAQMHHLSIHQQSIPDWTHQSSSKLSRPLIAALGAIGDLMRIRHNRQIGRY